MRNTWYFQSVFGHLPNIANHSKDNNDVSSLLLRSLSRIFCSIFTCFFHSPEGMNFWREWDELLDERGSLFFRLWPAGKRWTEERMGWIIRRERESLFFRLWPAGKRWIIREMKKVNGPEKGERAEKIIREMKKVNAWTGEGVYFSVGGNGTNDHMVESNKLYQPSGVHQFLCVIFL